MDLWGAFFRAEGGNADDFIEKTGVLTKQAESVPNITGSFYQDINTNDKVSCAFYFISKGFINLTSSQNNESGCVYLDASRCNDAYGRRNEVAPGNFTIRIWKRTA